MDKRFLVFLSALVIALAGCASDTGDSSENAEDDTNETGSTGNDTNETSEGNGTLPDYPELSFTATESREGENVTYGFEGPETASAGWTKVSLTSQAMEPHQVIFYKLDEGATAEDAMAHLHTTMMDPANASEAPYESFGGVGGVTFGQTGTVLIDLEPGEYVLVCNVPDPAMVPHSMSGMTMNFTVTEAEGEELPAPTPKYTVGLRDYAFVLPEENFTAGTYVVAFTNEGDEPHEAPIAALAPGKTMNDLLQFFENPEGQPPGAFVGGVVDVPPGATHYALVTFEPDTSYGFVCFFHAKSDGAPHFVHGMVAEWHVE